MESKIRSVLFELGFIETGFLNRGDARFEDWMEPWLSKGYHAEMKWLENNRFIRVDPCSILNEGRSVITMAYRYGTTPPKKWGQKNPISNFAWGEDYHKVLKKKLKSAIEKLKSEIPGFIGRGFVDTAPLPEKVLAARSGIGWIGKNGLLIHPKHGSYLFLGEIVCNLELESTKPIEDQCGTCELCLKACPTKAIKNNRSIDAGRCLSYLTIEKRDGFNEIEEKEIGYHLFGCDICQQVCPKNKDRTPLADSPFDCYPRWEDLDIRQICDLKEEQFQKLREKSPLKRIKLEHLTRNAQAVVKNQSRFPDY
ncbi:MAG: tRNA epoxyqueuosine(34) reductase QueG [Deltaproteobacteria bacterium]|nr:tRNA epoxyqueuosine(34) reductase QueG [Deltaproteobacteria bacterium]